MELERFHPLVRRWFAARFGAPTPPQEAGWAHIRDGRDTLIAAPTGSGKTLAAFLWGINELVAEAASGELADRTTIVYVSPLKALGNDIQKNLAEPLAEVRTLAEEAGTPLPEIRVMVRSGDTPAAERALMVRTPPHVLITTPESFYILLTAERSRRFLSTARAVIVDEIHAVAGDKRGSHLALSLERLDLLCGRPLQRIGLSATQKPIEEVARLLVGAGRETPAGHPDCAIVDVGHRRAWDLSIEVPDIPLGPIATHEMYAQTYDRIVALSKEHRTTLVFVNTRRLVERVAHQLEERLGKGRVAAHHGSLSRKIRLDAERGLKSGEIPVVVATASLELGIDIGTVDVVCDLGAPRSLATMLQRIGRSGHWVGSVPKGILFPLTRDDLLQSAAAVRAARAGELDRLEIPANALDVLAQQIVATAAAGEISEAALWEMVRRTHPYRDLAREEFEQVLEMLSEGVATRHGRRSAHLHRDRVNGMVRGRRGARLAAITSGGAIPDTADYDVIEEPAETLVGKVNEDFAIESMAGDIFLLGNMSWRIRRVGSGQVRVEDAHGAPPTIPFWLGEAPARTPELSAAVSALREEITARLGDREALVAWLCAETGVGEDGAEQLADYTAATVAALGCVPTVRRVVAERFFDEGGGMQLVLHTPFGARVNRAWGLALRKRFCVTFDFELQAAATDDGIVLSLGEQHSFPLDSVFGYVRTATLEDTLVQAALQSPMFGTRWRWNATRALALLRHTGGSRVPMPIQRMRAEDLLAAVFPEQVACQDNSMGAAITPPDHPLVTETMRNCLHEVMDMDGLRAILERLEAGEIEAVAVETPQPSPASHEILNANPYAFLDDAPLEERRARAVALRRTDPDLAAGPGALDSAAIAEVRAQAAPDVRDPDELHDHLLSAILLPEEETGPWASLGEALVEAGRATVASWNDPSGRGRRAVVAAERVAHAALALPGATFDPPTKEFPAPDATREDVVRTILRARLQHAGPVTEGALAAALGLPEPDVAVAMLALENEGTALRGTFTPGAVEREWCDRRLLARIHRVTLGRLRREIEPVSPADFVRFLLRWQHVQPGTQLHGREGVAQVIGQLQGLELPAPAWESLVLPARVQGYAPADLEYLCLSGVVAWGKLAAAGAAEEDEEPAAPRGTARRQKPGRGTPLGFVLREDLESFVSPARSLDAETASLSTVAGEIAAHLAARGASFMTDIVKATGRLPAEVEDALWELVSAGLVTGDGVAGFRRLLRMGERRPRPQTRLRAVATRPRPLAEGRWSLWRTDVQAVGPHERVEAFARQLLRRYGVVFREVLGRERLAPSWRALLGVYRTLEMRQEVRGGRFVSGFVGEQFALPEAVEALRAVRRAPADTDPAIISAADPLNLVGVVLPGPRAGALSGLSIAYRDGVAVEVAPLGTLRSRFHVEAR